MSDIQYTHEFKGLTDTKMVRMYKDLIPKEIRARHFPGLRTRKDRSNTQHRMFVRLLPNHKDPIEIKDIPKLVDFIDYVEFCSVASYRRSRQVLPESASILYDLYQYYDNSHLISDGDRVNYEFCNFEIRNNDQVWYIPRSVFARCSKYVYRLLEIDDTITHIDIPDRYNPKVVNMILYIVKEHIGLPSTTLKEFIELCELYDFLDMSDNITRLIHAGLTETNMETKKNVHIEHTYEGIKFISFEYSKMYFNKLIRCLERISNEYLILGGHFGEDKIMLRNLTDNWKANHLTATNKLITELSTMVACKDGCVCRICSIKKTQTHLDNKITSTQLQNIRSTSISNAQWVDSSI